MQHFFSYSKLDIKQFWISFLFVILEPKTKTNSLLECLFKTLTFTNKESMVHSARSIRLFIFFWFFICKLNQQWHAIMQNNNSKRISNSIFYAKEIRIIPCACGFQFFLLLPIDYNRQNYINRMAKRPN